MRKKIIWMLASFLMVMSLVVASCAPKEVEEKKPEKEEAAVAIQKAEEEEVAAPPEEMVKVTLRKTDGTTMEKMVERPKYGGTIRLQPLLSAMGFNVFAMNHIYCGTVYLTNEELICGDWSKGPAGTGENDFFDGFAGQIKFTKGWLCESWELPDDQTIIFHIRKGVHWWDKPPINGRELTAYDVAWSLNKHFSSPLSYVYASFALTGMSPTSVKALDKYTVEVKLPPGVQGMWLVCVGDEAYIFPENITELVDLNDWRNAIGTSPWMLTDFVRSVSETYERNPNYWQYDPIFPENRLPYPDKQICLNISDTSTAEAAFRTGKLDRYSGFTRESAYQLLKENPHLKLIKWQTSGVALSGNVANPESPWSDIRVRRALNMAVNKQELIDEYYGGDAVMLGYPIKAHKAWSAMYTPLEEMPESIQELFKYNPEKAKQLLAEAGYPNGFKTSVVTSAARADFLSIIKGYFANVGVDMTIEPLETGAWWGVWMGRKYKDMIYATLKPEHPYMFYCELKENFWDTSFWSDPRVDEAYTKIKKVLGIDDAEVVRIMKEITPVILESAWGVFLPTGYMYNVYWPWFKGWNGEFDICYNAQGRDRTFVWIDTALKKSMGY